MSELIRKIDAFLDRHAMEPSRFGVLAVNDGHLYFSLSRGRKLRRITLRKIAEFMADYKPTRKNGGKNGHARSK